MDRKDFSSARASLLKALDLSLSPEQREQVLQTMVALNQHLFYNEPTTPDLEQYRVRDGDSLHKIARKFSAHHVTPGILKLANRLPDDRLRVNRKILIPKGTFSFLVVKSRFRLYLMYDGTALREYVVATGKDNATPPGDYVAGEKTSNPTWYPPEHLRDLPRRIPPGDPRNPLGSHWIALKHPVHQGLGIHGTNDPATIGTSATLGCVRLANSDVQEVYDILYPGMAVRIVE
jgi:lipoprotein-anchoring transpeptidase ErfK/SrfK